MNGQRLSRRLLLWVLLILLMLGTLACEEQPTGPRAWIDVPLDGSSVPVGTTVPVISHAYAQEGVAEVLLSVNGQAYRRNPPAQPDATFSKASLDWIPQQEGDYVLQVKAYSKNGQSSNPATVRVRAIGKATPTPTLVRPITAVITPVTPTALSDLAIVSVDAMFVSYKGTVALCKPHVVYRNAGTVPVPKDYVIQLHINGTPQMAVTRGAGFGVGGTSELVFDYLFEGTPYIGVNLDSTSAVTESNETNNAFAEARMCSGGPVAWFTDTPTPTPTDTPTLVRPTTPTPTHTPTLVLPPPPGCSGTPSIASFGASPSTITAGQSTTLSWGAVTNADSVSIEPGIGGVATPGSRTVSPAKTTTYTLTARCGGNTQTRQTTVTVTSAPATPTSTPTRTRTPTTPPDTTPPPIPNPQDPTGGESVSCPGATGSATLKWSSVSDPSGVTYYVKWNGAGQSGGWEGTGTSHGISIKCGYQYSWQVRACDGAGNCSNWSSSATFLAGTLH